MQIGLDIGRQYVKMVVVEKTRDGLKLLNVDSKLIPEKNKPFDPENIDTPLIVMAVKELINRMNLKPKHFRHLTTGISGSNISIKQITTMLRNRYFYINTSLMNKAASCENSCIGFV